MSVDEVWLWYHRLAEHLGRRKVRGSSPLSALFLSSYVSPQSRTGPFTFRAPSYLREHSIVLQALRFHRRVYLTQERARIAGSRRWAGIKPRWEDPGRYGWNRRDPLEMHYEALVEVPMRWQVTGNDAEKDILYGLGRGFQLRTEVIASVRSNSGRLDVAFDRFEARVVDRYDFDPGEHITVPNPDHGAARANAVCPHRDRIVVYHRNAIRMEQAHRASPYDLESLNWEPTDRAVVGPGQVDL